MNEYFTPGLLGSAADAEVELFRMVREGAENSRPQGCFRGNQQGRSPRAFSDASHCRL